MDRSTPRLRTRPLAGVELGLFAGVIAADVPRMFLLGIAPLLLSAFVDDRGFGEEQAAWLSSGELLASSIAAIAIAGWLTRGSRRAVAFYGLGLAVSAQLVSMAHFNFMPFLALRILAGTGAGLAAAAATAAIAGTENPERVFAIAGLFIALLGAVLVGPVGMAIGTYGAAGALAIVGVFTILCAPFLSGLPAPVVIERTALQARDRRHVVPGLAVLGALFAFMLGQNAVWSFTARIGQAAGLSVEDISWILAVTGMAGLAGALGAATLGTRRGRTLPLLFSIAATVVTVIVLARSTTPLVFAAANAAWTFLFAFSVPYFAGTLAALDASGRWAAMGSGVAGFGAAIGPAAVGGIIEANGYASLGFVMIAMGLITTTLVTPVLLRLDRTARAIRAS